MSTQPPGLVTPNICQTCGKRKKSFLTRSEAKRVARLTRYQRIRVYPCGLFFHLTSVAADRIAALRATEGTTP